MHWTSQTPVIFYFWKIYNIKKRKCRHNIYLAPFKITGEYQNVVLKIIMIENTDIKIQDFITSRRNYYF